MACLWSSRIEFILHASITITNAETYHLQEPAYEAVGPKNKIQEEEISLHQQNTKILNESEYYLLSQNSIT